MVAKRLLIFLSVLVCVTGLLVCGAVLYVSGLHIYGYHYISLENVDGIETVGHGDSEVSALYMADPMPVSYRLDRERYLLAFEVRKDTFSPEIVVSVSSQTNGDLELRRSARMPDGRCLKNFHFDTSRKKVVFGFRDEASASRGLGFSWKDCAVGAASGDQVLSFDVRDLQDNIVGTEDIPFDFIENGYFLLFDSL